jgi:hypothetical protein
VSSAGSSGLLSTSPTGPWVVVAVGILTVSFLWVGIQGASATPAAPVAATSHPSSGSEGRGYLAPGGGSSATLAPLGGAGHRVKTLCGGIDFVTGAIYPIFPNRAYVESWSDGNISLCGNGRFAPIAQAPPGFDWPGYFGMAGVKVGGQVDLLLISFLREGGWVCVNVTTDGCASNLTFSLPTSFCGSEPILGCDPDGVVVTPNLSFTYVDSANAQMVTCAPLATSCAVDAGSSAFAGYVPTDIAQSGSTYYVSDDNCSGLVWSGTTSSMSTYATIGSDLGGIAVRHGNVYVGVSGDCVSSGVAHIEDVTTGVSLRTPYNSTGDIFTLDSKLQFDQGDAQPTTVYSV